ncbi:unnamed protein product, partial [Brassica rapa subsp. narinosa]
MYFNDISPGLSESQLRFRLIHFWEAKNIAKGGTLIGVGMGLPNSTASNLEAIGDRLGKLELSDAVDGRIKVAMDSSK